MIKNYILLTIISPIVSLILIIKNFNRSNHALLFTINFAIFSVLMTFREINQHMISQANTFFRGTGDGTRLIGRIYIYYTNMSFEDFISQSYSIIIMRTTNSPSDDLFIHILGYFTGSVLGMPRLFIVITAIILGLLFSLSIQELTKLVKTKNIYNKYTIIFFIGLILPYFIFTSINALRSALASWYIVYMLLKYFNSNKDIKYLFLLLFSYFFHFSYILYSIIIILSLILLYKSTITYFAILSMFYISFIFTYSSTNFDYLFNYMAEIDVFGKRSGYIIEDENISVLDRTLGSRIDTYWYVRYQNLSYVLIQLFMFTLIGINRNIRKYMNSIEMKILYCSMTLMIFANTLSFIPQIGNRVTRFSVILTCLSLFLFFVRFNNNVFYKRNSSYINVKKVRIIYSSILFVLLLPIVLTRLSQLVDMISIYYIIFPFLELISPESNIALKIILEYLFNFIA